MSTLTAVRDLERFLSSHPEVAAIAHVVIGPEGRITIQLVKDTGRDEQTRRGILYGLAATYSGDCRVDTAASALHAELLWRDRVISVFTPVEAPVRHMAVTS